jgi:hypothetical protein
MITPVVWRAWHALVARSLPRLQGLDPAAIPDEAGRIEPDGSLTIFVPLPNGSEIVMPVPLAPRLTMKQPSSGIRLECQSTTT